ncbi:hypothetical protein ZWY2020_048071 [Hordeum vulgare]|nr:hypothetical protein ZWY2020_048071 [Hordeum vulgare]
MALIDCIELSDDAEIIELSSDEENVEEYHNASTQSNSAQHQATLHDDKTMFIAEGEGGEEATESGNAEEATASSFVTERESGNPEEATASSSVTEKESGNPEEAIISQTCPHTPTAVATEKESGNPEETSQTFHHTPTAVTFPVCPDSIPPKALTFETCVAKPWRAKALTFETCVAKTRRVKAKRRRKLYTGTPRTWRSPRLEEKHKGRRRLMEELAVELKRSRMLEEEEEEEEKNTSARSRKKSKLFGEQCRKSPAG